MISLGTWNPSRAVYPNPEERSREKRRKGEERGWGENIVFRGEGSNNKHLWGGAKVPPSCLYCSPLWSHSELTVPQPHLNPLLRESLLENYQTLPQGLQPWLTDTFTSVCSLCLLLQLPTGTPFWFFRFLFCFFSIKSSLPKAVRAAL